MALLAVLNHGDPSWNGNYAQIEFHSYNERYEGSYPNLYFCFDVQARIVAINSGWWMIQANTTFNYGGVQQTHYIYTNRVYGTSGWYFVGSHRKSCGCGRSFTFSDDCSVSGYPNLSGNGSITSPTIEEPSFTARAENIDQRTCDIVWDTTDNPYNMYRMYVKAPNGTYSSQLPMDGRYSLEGLNSNTSYTYRVEAWQADGRGSAVAAKDVTFKTLENYPEISVTEVTYEIEDAGETDNVTFRFKSTDDSHVSKWHYQIQGGPPFSGTSPTYSESRLAKNLESYIDVWTEDTLGRTSTKFRQYFHTTFTKMTVWRRMKTNGYQLFDASKLATTEAVDGITITNNNDGSFILNGTSKNVILFSTLLDKIVEKGKKYTISANNDSVHGGVLIRLGYIHVDEASQVLMNSKNATVTFTATRESNEFVIRIASGLTLNNFKIKPMLNKEEPKAWEPYTGGKPFDGYLRGFMYCIQNMLWGYARPYILNTGRKWLNALPYDIVRRFVFSGKTNAAGLEVHKIYGNTVQVTTKGINLANYNSKGNNVNVGDVKTGKKYTFFFNQDYESGFNLRIIVSGQSYILELDKKDISALARAVFTADSDGVLFYNGYANSSNSKNFMLVEGDVYDNVSSIQYEPYTGGQPAPYPDYPMEIENVEISEITSHGRNLLEIRKLTEKTLSGVTFTPVYVGENLECVIVNGTATAQANYVLSNRLNFDKKLVMQGCPVGGSSSRYSLLCVYYNRQSKAYKNEVYDMGDGKNVDTDIYETQFSILIRQGTKCNNLIFYPMLRRTDDTDTSYTPYQSDTIETNLTLAQDDIYQNGTIARNRKQDVFDGSSDEAWNLQSINDYGIANFYISAQRLIRDSKEGVCNRFIKQQSLITDTKAEGFHLSNNLIYIRITKERASTVEAFKTWLQSNPVIVEYELASPTTEYVTIPTITSFDTYTVAFTDSEVETQIEWRPAASSTLNARFYAVEQYRKVLNKNT